MSYSAWIDFTQIECNKCEKILNESDNYVDGLGSANDSLTDLIIASNSNCEACIQHIYPELLEHLQQSCNRLNRII